MKFHPAVLNQEESFLLENLEFLKKAGFYLAGGTALALQLGHRTSVDLDFYNQNPFKLENVLRAFTTNIPKAKTIGTAEGTIYGKFKKTEFSLFHYPYKLLKNPVSFRKVLLASTIDIGAMKIGAIIQRGTKRDFIDIHYLLKKYSLRKLISFTLKKYPSYQEILILQALIYFKDAEEERKKRPIKALDKNFSWEKAKKEIFEEVRKYQLGMIKKD